GMSHPEMRAIEASRTRVLAPIHIDLAPNMRSAFIHDENSLLFGKLDDLHGVRCRLHARTARRSAHAFGIVLRFVHGVIVIQRSGPGFEWNPWLGGSSAALSATAATTTTGALARGGCWSRRRSHDNISGAHISNVEQIPDAFFAGFTTEVYSPIS